MTRQSEELRAEINKLLKKEVVHKGSDKKFETQYMSTGVLPFDIIMGGGIPRGRYVELTGDYSTLKSFLALNTIAETQKSGGMAALIDTEHAYDKEWAKYLGVDDDALLLVQPETGEEGIDAMELMVRNEVDFICLDSVAATLPQAEAEVRIKDAKQPGRQANMMSKAFRKLTAVNSRTGMLLINQLRQQIGITFGPAEKAPGGLATGFYASMRINCRKAGKVTREAKSAGWDKEIVSKEQIGQTYRMTVEKSKLNRPWRELLFDWSLEHNEVDRAKFLMLQGMDLSLVSRKGNTWHCAGETLVASKENFYLALRERADWLDHLEREVRTAHGLFVPPGLLPPRKKAAVNANAKSSKVLERGRTPAQARVASRLTAPRKTKLSK